MRICMKKTGQVSFLSEFILSRRNPDQSYLFFTKTEFGSLTLPFIFYKYTIYFLITKKIKNDCPQALYSIITTTAH